MQSSNIASPHDQSATFVELFFDLVFVFSVTQVVGLLHGGGRRPRDTRCVRCEPG